MNMSVPFVIFISGVSGAGKTTLLKKLCSQMPAESTACLHFDSIGVPSVEEMINQYGGPSEWQRAMTERWIDKLLTEYKNKKLIFLEGQVNLMFFEEACKKHNFTNYKTILIHCDDAIRHERLRINREQPELINQDMDNWAHFLKRQAQEMRVPILDSGKMTIDEMADWIIRSIDIEQTKSFLQKNVPALSIQSMEEKQGDDHTVAVVNDAWIFRFAKSPDIQQHMGIEIKLLNMLENKITCVIPKVAYYFPEAYCFGYQKISGALFSAAMYAQLTAEEKKNLADDFAQFLHELHSNVSVDAAKPIGLSPADWPLRPEVLQAKLASITDKSLQEVFDRFIAEYQQIVSTEQKLMIVHNDLHADNILIDPKTKKLSVIIDFTSAAIDTAYHDFRYLHLIDMNLVPLAVQSYNQKTGEDLIVRNAYVYCMATEFSRLAEAMEQNDLIKADEIKQRIYELNDDAL